MNHIAWSIPDFNTTIIESIDGIIYNKTAEEISNEDGSDFYTVLDADGDPCIAHNNIWLGAIPPDCIVDMIPVPKTSFTPPTPPFKPW